MSTQEKTIREAKKGRKLEYANIVGQETAPYLLLGTLARSLGKEWVTTFFAPQDERGTLLHLQHSLKTPALLKILNVEDAGKIDKTTNLVVSAYTSPEKNKQIRNAGRVLGQSHVITLDSRPNEHEYDLISEFETKTLNKNGVIAITGDGKGKTTTALGYAVKSYLEGGNAAIIQWFKEKRSGKLTWAINEHSFPQQLKDPNRFTFYPTGAGFVGSPAMDRVAEAK